MIKKGFLSCYLLSVLVLGSCAEPKILEKVGLITTMGYDLGENGSFLGTMVELKIDPNVSKDVVILESESLSIRGIRTNANNKSAKRIATGQAPCPFIWGRNASKWRDWDSPNFNK